MTKQKLTVAICTYNRAASLEHTLFALALQQVPAELNWETILVDNNSTDETRAVAARFEQEGRPPYLRYVFEGQQGLSHARNRAIAESRGDILLFTDDDVRPEPDWIARLVTQMDAHGCDGAGGWIGPIWEKEPPAWLTEQFYGFLAIRPDDKGPQLITADCPPPFGANMAFRRNVFERLGVFDPALGRTGNVLAGGEEWDLFQRLIEAGGKVMYFPDARVHHVVEAYRLRKAYFRRWRYQGSRNQAQLTDIAGNRRILGVPPYLLTQLLSAAWAALSGRLSSPEDEVLRRDMLVGHFAGMIAGCHARWRAGRELPG